MNLSLGLPSTNQRFRPNDFLARLKSLEQFEVLCRKNFPWSDRRPQTLHKVYQYLGGQKILKGVTDTEQRFFVETYANGTTTSVFWLQFEALLPEDDFLDNYDSSPLRVQISNYEFSTDTATAKNTPTFFQRRERPADFLYGRSKASDSREAVTRDRAETIGDSQTHAEAHGWIN